MEKEWNIKGPKTINEIIKEERNKKIKVFLKKEVQRLICMNEHKGNTGRPTEKQY